MGLALALVLLVAAAAGLQAQAPVSSASEPEPQATGAADTAVDPSKLGVSVSRIQRGLRMSEARERFSGTPFKIGSRIQVFGTAPRLELLKDFDISPATPAQKRDSSGDAVNAVPRQVDASAK